MLLACLFCLLKTDRNKDERQRHSLFIHCIVSIFLLYQGHKTRQSVRLQRTMFLGTAASSLKSCRSYDTLR